MTLEDLTWFALIVAVYAALNFAMYRYQLCWLYRLYGKEPPPIFNRPPQTTRGDET